MDVLGYAVIVMIASCGIMVFFAMLVHIRFIYVDYKMRKAQEEERKQQEEKKRKLTSGKS